ncbi:MAG TPA: hypothetical protein VLC95_19210 [Anaerolineae bacterium]|nr:hypothetical protein [Anaerolineae bacterium]
MGSFDRNSLIIGIVAGLVLGIILGMVLFWGPFAVQYEGAQPYHMVPDERAEYVGLVADNFRLYNDINLAASYLEGWTQEERAEAVALAVDHYDALGRPDKVQAIEDLATVLGIAPTAAPPPVEEERGLFERFLLPCFVFLAILLVFVFGWIGLRVALRQRSARPAPAAPMRPAPAVTMAEEWDGSGQPPLGHFITTYELGEDTYDESFSIETPMGEFLGECGVGISETVGAGGAPDKVTAFEVWLFDKSDIRTVTKVLMSEYAYNDSVLRAKLASKGEAVLAQPGQTFALETTGLQVHCSVEELLYGNGGEAPPRSYFARLKVELVANIKQA